jgi:hypothetical protein
MSKGIIREKIRKDDFLRILSTETLPYETPLIHSNDGFHKNIKNGDKNEIFVAIINNIIKQQNLKPTIPYKYKIRKNTTELRTLAIIHPASQLKFVEFYKKYGKLICHFCNSSAFSIRAPYKVASTFFYKNSWENISEFKRGDVSNVDTDQLTKHSSSYFAYRGHDRLFKFYNSKDFLNIEKDYGIFLCLDVSKCFDSIYTHSIAWATKSKENTKSNLRITTTFGQVFDSLMQQSNYNETNGILIGPEISRIFAEIIFQRIDSTVEQRLDSLSPSATNGKDYTIRRYVDDIFIFAKTTEHTKLIAEIYTEELNNYNLHVNRNKVVQYSRPFFSTKSRVITETNFAINTFSDNFLDSRENNERLIPKRIYNSKKLTKSFIDSVKSICSSNQVDYDSVSSYIISAITNRIKKIINIKSPEEIEVTSHYTDALDTLTEVLFFFYTTAPSVNASYKLSTSIILISRFTKKYLPEHNASINQRVHELTLQLLTGDLIYFKSTTKNFVYLEALNIVLACSELGVDCMLPPVVLNELLTAQSSYYDLMSCLYYIKNLEAYSPTKTIVERGIDLSLRDLSDLSTNTEKACIFLDSISCPYLDDDRKSKYVKRFYRSIGQKIPNDQQINGFLKKALTMPWFINWTEIDLLNMLEKKELKEVY